MAEQVKASLATREREIGLTHRVGQQTSQMAPLVKAEDSFICIALEKWDACVNLRPACLTAEQGAMGISPARSRLSRQHGAKLSDHDRRKMDGHILAILRITQIEFRAIEV